MPRLESAPAELESTVAELEAGEPRGRHFLPGRRAPSRPLLPGRRARGRRAPRPLEACSAPPARAPLPWPPPRARLLAEIQPGRAPRRACVDADEAMARPRGAPVGGERGGGGRARRRRGGRRWRSSAAPASSASSAPGTRKTRHDGDRTAGKARRDGGATAGARRREEARGMARRCICPSNCWRQQQKKYPILTTVDARQIAFASPICLSPVGVSLKIKSTHLVCIGSL